MKTVSQFSFFYKGLTAFGLWLLHAASPSGDGRPRRDCGLLSRAGGLCSQRLQPGASAKQRTDALVPVLPGYGEEPGARKWLSAYFLFCFTTHTITSVFK